MKGTWGSLLCRDRTFYDCRGRGSALQVLGDPGNLPDLIYSLYSFLGKKHTRAKRS